MEKQETSFEAYTFDEEELAAARVISHEHRCYLKTLLSDAAEEKIRLKLDPYKPLVFVQQDAYLQGQMDMLAMLLSDDRVARPKLVAQTEANSTQKE